MPQVTYATQPFWSDVFIVALNTQFSAWDYPDSPVLQPMGNVQLIPIPLMQMVNCAATPNATQTSTPNPSNIDHFVSFAPVGGGANVYIWLGGDDCTNILGLDFFHAAKTQSAVPPAFRAFQSGRFDTHVPETFNEQSTVTGTSGTGQKEQFVSKGKWHLVKFIMASAPLIAGFEEVFTVTDYYDGPRQGIANFKGQPHFYDCIFSEVKQDYTNLYRLTPVAQDLFRLAMEDWEIWKRWERAFHAGQAMQDSHPALPADAPRHLEIKMVLDARLKTDTERCLVRAGAFMKANSEIRPKGVLVDLLARFPEPDEEERSIWADR